MIPLRDSIPSSTFPLVNWVLILTNVAIFVYEVSLPPEALEAFVFQWGAVPAAFNPAAEAFAPVQAMPTLLSGMFIHGGVDHILGNMLFLWIFGDNVEDRLGHLSYLIFYLLCGLVASLAQIFFSLGSTVPIIGASGAIGGVMGAYMIAFPHSHVLTFFWFFFLIRMVWIPAAFYLVLWFGLQLLYAIAGAAAVSGAEGGGVAFWAHVGGFAAGMALLPVMQKRRPRPAPAALGLRRGGAAFPARRRPDSNFWS